MLKELMKWIFAHLATPTIEKEIVEIVVEKVVTGQNEATARDILTHAKTIVDAALEALPPIGPPAQ